MLASSDLPDLGPHRLDLRVGLKLAVVEKERGVVVAVLGGFEKESERRWWSRWRC
jgi:hypothetical protein